MGLLRRMIGREGEKKKSKEVQKGKKTGLGQWQSPCTFLECFPVYQELSQTFICTAMFEIGRGFLMFSAVYSAPRPDAGTSLRGESIWESRQTHPWTLDMNSFLGPGLSHLLREPWCGDQGWPVRSVSLRLSRRFPSSPAGARSQMVLKERAAPCV